MKKIITSKEIEEYICKGIKEVMISDELIITSIAKEIASKNDVKFIHKSDKVNLNIIYDGQKDIADNDYEVDLLIENGYLVMPGIGIIKNNLSICKDKIVSINAMKNTKAKRVIDAEGKYVIPGIIDPHVHLGIFQPLEVELNSELKSALVGGVTTCGVFANGEESHIEKIKNIEQLLSNSTEEDIFIHVCIMNEKQLNEIDSYIDLGIKSFKFYMCGIPGIINSASDEFLLEAFSRLSKKNNIVTLVHAENEAAVKLFTNNMLREGIENLSDWSKTHPAWGEAEAIERASRYSSIYNLPIYFVHVSSKEGLEAIKNVKRNYKSKIYAETTSPYLTLNNEIRSISVTGKMVPPIRGIKDSNALWEGCMGGTINSIGTDNTTLNKDEKNYYKGIKEAIPGYPTLETHLSSMINEGLNNRGLDLLKIIELMTANPAKIFGIFPQKGTIMPGSDADIVILDIKKDKVVSSDSLYSRANFSLFDNMKLKGWPIMTIKSGKVVAEGGYYIGSETGGKLIKR